MCLANIQQMNTFCCISVYTKNTKIIPCVPCMAAATILCYTKGCMESAWYSQLVKPTWAPPSWLFGPVWTGLYILIAISFGAVFYKAITRQIPWMVAVPFLLNLIFNFLFTYVQFGLKNNVLASIDVVLVLGTLVWGMVAILVTSLKLSISAGGPDIRWIVYMNIPYLVWVTFASVLQITITIMNK